VLPKRAAEGARRVPIRPVRFGRPGRPAHAGAGTAPVPRSSSHGWRMPCIRGGSRSGQRLVVSRGVVGRETWMRVAQARRPFGLPALFLVFGAVAAWLVACTARTPGARAYPELVRFAGREIDDVDFEGAGPIPKDTLDELVRTEATRCRI